ncbi:Sister chromatid cohesion protein SCC2, partial [Linum grandiflorum]
KYYFPRHLFPQFHSFLFRILGLRSYYLCNSLTIPLLPQLCSSFFPHIHFSPTTLSFHALSLQIPISPASPTMSNPTAEPSGSSSGFSLQGIGLSNTIHSEVAPCLPLPSLPVFCGASDPEIRLFDDRGGAESLSYLDRSEIVAQSARIAQLLRGTDVSYINLRNNARPMTLDYVIPLELCDHVLQCNPEAFEHSTPGKAQLSGNIASESRHVHVESSIPVMLKVQNDDDTQNNQNSTKLNDIGSSSRKPKGKKKGGEATSALVQLEPTALPELQDAIIRNFCDALEDFCAKSEVPSDDQEEVEWLAVPASDVRLLVNEIMMIRGKKLLHLVPLEALVRLLRILDHQIHRAEGLSVDQCDHVSP